MRKLMIALLVLLPAAALAQQKYTNADLDRAPREDAYTNADLEKLLPLPVGEARPLEPLAPLHLERSTAVRQINRTELFSQLDAIDAEIRYWRDIRVAARYPGVDRNAYPRFGSDTAEARQRLKELDRERVLLLAEYGSRR